MKPFAEACERNQAPILEVLREELTGTGTVLEIGSGTGQHAVYFGARLPDLVWMTSDLPAAHLGIEAWLDEAALENVRRPLVLDVNQRVWPIDRVDAIYTANTMHILGWRDIVSMFSGIGRVLAPGGRLLLYGPFRFDGRYTSESNERFDRFLRTQDPRGGIRDFEALDALASPLGLRFRRNHRMPSHNQILVWERSVSGGDVPVSGAS